MLDPGLAALKQAGAALIGASARDKRHFTPVSSADFDLNYQPINAGYPAAAASSYTVRTGDTLSSIAQAVWGDASLWYLIAQANGLSFNASLAAGQTLIIPNVVANFRNNTTTFKPYNPGQAIGDTLPTLPHRQLYKLLLVNMRAISQIVLLRRGRP